MTILYRVLTILGCMDIQFDSIVSIISLLAGGGGLGVVCGWRYAKRKAAADAKKAEAEAKTAEAETQRARAEAESVAAEAAQKVQDVYQDLLNRQEQYTDRQKSYIEEQQAYIEEQKAFIAELKSDRHHLREEQKELIRRQGSLETSVLDLKRDVARNNRMIDFMRPLLCGRDGCAIRVPVTVSEGGVSRPACPQEESDEAVKDNGIEPVEMEAI